MTVSAFEWYSRKILDKRNVLQVPALTTSNYFSIAINSTTTTTTTTTAREMAVCFGQAEAVYEPGQNADELVCSAYSGQHEK